MFTPEEIEGGRSFLSDLVAVVVATLFGIADVVVLVIGAPIAWPVG